MKESLFGKDKREKKLDKEREGKLEDEAKPCSFHPKLDPTSKLIIDEYK